MNNDLAWLGVLCNLGKCYLDRFEARGDLVDLSCAFDCLARALSRASIEDVQYPSCLDALGSAYMCRLKCGGQLSDLDTALQYRVQAVSLTPNTHDDKPSMLINLGVSYWKKYEHLGQLADLNEAIENQKKATLLMRDEHPGIPVCLGNLGASHLTRYKRLGEIQDLDLAISYQDRAVQLMADDHPGKPGYISNLGNAYHSHYKRVGDLISLEKAIQHHEKAVDLSPDGSINKPGYLNNLGIVYQGRYEHLGQLIDLDTSINCKRQSVHLTPEAHPMRAARLNNLGNSYEIRFERLGELSDLDTSIDTKRQAVLLTKGEDPYRPGRLNDLSVAYHTRYLKLGDLGDLESGIVMQSEAVELTADNDSNKPIYFNSLGSLYHARYLHLRNLADLDSAIRQRTLASELTPVDHPRKLMILNNLSGVHHSRFRHLGLQEDLDRAISYMRLAIERVPDDHLQRSELLAGLAELYYAQYDISKDRCDINQALSYLQQAVSFTGGHPHVKQKAARQWARWGTQQKDSMEGYRNFMLLIPQVVWLGLATENRYEATADIADVALEAATKAIQLREYEQALEWLEQGRSIVWNQMIKLRSPLESVHVVNPTLAEEIKSVAQELNCAVSLHDPVTSRTESFTYPEEATQRHHRLAEKWENLVEQIRSHREMNHFLSPVKASDLLAASHLGAVVVVVNYVSTTSYSFKEVGLMLWEGIAKPVLKSLGYDNPISTLKNRPRIIWCVTGPLSQLPLHAAGDYSQPHCALSDYAVSSYTPTLSALLAPGVNHAHFSGVALKELEQVETHVQGVPITRLDGVNASKLSVLDAMEQHSWLHLACHAGQNVTNPAASAIYLSDGPLDLGAIAQKNLKNASLAFLSACQTASGDKRLSEEAIHLAAGMILAGYRSVVATMWPIEDQDAPLVAAKFYDYVFSNLGGNEPDFARALQYAVESLKDQVGVDEYERWAPYIHIGR
ncbi:CHAT domain protein [Ceratobasidium sp. AG-Ba]|nr:CHAT domain protein [Ceratobasidium sp. AG-Ba]